MSIYVYEIQKATSIFLYTEYNSPIGSGISIIVQCPSLFKTIWYQQNPQDASEQLRWNIMIFLVMSIIIKYTKIILELKDVYICLHDNHSRMQRNVHISTW